MIIMIMVIMINSSTIINNSNNNNNDNNDIYSTRSRTLMNQSYEDFFRLARAWAGLNCFEFLHLISANYIEHCEHVSYFKDLCGPESNTRNGG